MLDLQSPVITVFIWPSLPAAARILKHLISQLTEVEYAPVENR